MAGQPLTDEEIVSNLRNCTAGDLGPWPPRSASSCPFALRGPDPRGSTQARGDKRLGGVSASVEESLRSDDPFQFTRRVATETVEHGEVSIREGEPVLLN